MSTACHRVLGCSLWTALVAALAVTAWAGDAGRAAVKVTLVVECAYRSDGSTIVSPDGKHVAYWQDCEEDTERVGEDDHCGPRFEHVSGLVFNPASQRLAYIATVYEGGKYLDTVVSGPDPAVAKYDDIRDLQFSPDGKRMAYVARPLGPRGHQERQFLVVDGKEGKKHDDIRDVLFSPDSQRVAYLAVYKDVKAHGVVVDGQEDRRYDEVLWLKFSPDSQHVTYWGRRGGTWCCVVDGAVTKTQDCHGWPPVFSSDGRRAAYVVKREAGEALVVDGQEGKAYDRIGWRGFSPALRQAQGAVSLPNGDGQQVAFEAHRGTKQVMVVNGLEGPAYDEVSVLAGFSPDGKRFAYRARRDKTWRAVVDNREGKARKAIWSFVFSPDSRHFAYDAEGEKAHVLVVDGEDVAEYTEILSRHAPMAFVAPGQLRLFAMRGAKALRVDVAVGGE